MVHSDLDWKDHVAKTLGGGKGLEAANLRAESKG